LKPDICTLDLNTMNSGGQVVINHVRVGLEDKVYLAKGELAPSNASMVEKARRIVQDLGGQIASARRSTRHRRSSNGRHELKLATTNQAEEIPAL
jgi:uncharacterized protein (DUF849 family)